MVFYRHPFKCLSEINEKSVLSLVLEIPGKLDFLPYGDFGDWWGRKSNTHKLSVYKPYPGQKTSLSKNSTRVGKPLIPSDIGGGRVGSTGTSSPRGVRTSPWTGVCRTGDTHVATNVNVGDVKDK